MRQWQTIAILPIPASLSVLDVRIAQRLAARKDRYLSCGILSLVGR